MQSCFGFSTAQSNLSPFPIVWLYLKAKVLSKVKDLALFFIPNKFNTNYLLLIWHHYLSYLPRLYVLMKIDKESHSHSHPFLFLFFLNFFLFFIICIDRWCGFVECAIRSIWVVMGVPFLSGELS